MTVRALVFRVPKPSKALYAAALRVATGNARRGDAARVRAEFPGYDLVFAARVIVLRGLWHEPGKDWHE